MPPTPRPRTGSAAPSSSTPTPASAGPSRTNKAASGGPDTVKILNDIGHVFILAARGGIQESGIQYIRQTIFEQYRYIIEYAIHSGRTNPLLEMPPELDPSVASEKSPALVSPEEWQVMVTSTEVNARTAQAMGTLGVPVYEPVEAGSTVNAASSSSPAPSGSPMPVSGVGRRAAGSSGVATAGGLGSNSPSPAATGNTTVPATISTLTAAQAALPATGSNAGASNKILEMPKGLLTPVQMKQITAAAAAEREELFKREPALKRKFDVSFKYYQLRVRQAHAASDGSSGAGSNTAQSIQSSAPDQVGSTAVESGSGSGADNAVQARNVPIPTVPPIPILGNPNFTLSQPPPPRAGPGAGAATASTGAATTSDTAAAASAPAPAPAPGNPPASLSGIGSTSRPMQTSSVHSNAFASTSVTTSVQPTPSHNVDQQFGPYIPPPPRPAPAEEPESARRKRKYREWVGESGAGLEMEVGLDETLNEALDKFIIELIRGGFRLAKHRQSNKVEIKDLAFYLGTLRFILGFHYGDGRGIMADQNADRYHSMSIPGFDAVPPRRTHVPVDTEERRRLRAVIPRLARRDGGEAGAAAAVPNEALAGSTPDRGAASEAVQ